MCIQPGTGSIAHDMMGYHPDMSDSLAKTLEHVNHNVWVNKNFKKYILLGYYLLTVVAFVNLLDHEDKIGHEEEVVASLDLFGESCHCASGSGSAAAGLPVAGCRPGSQ